MSFRLLPMLVGTGKKVQVIQPASEQKGLLLQPSNKQLSSELFLFASLDNLFIVFVRDFNIVKCPYT